jgi:ribulose-phosphate 3-epimerase
MFFDVHLMCSRPEILLEPFAKAGADQITVHVELGDQVTPLLWKIKSLGKKTGLAVNPPTPISLAQPFLEQIDCLLVMTVNPGFGGQPFIHETLPKIQQAQAWRAEKKLAYRIEVDGGINFQTAAECARAGADTFVSGAALFRQHNLPGAVKKLRKIAVAAAQAATLNGEFEARR